MIHLIYDEEIDNQGDGWLFNKMFCNQKYSNIMLCCKIEPWSFNYFQAGQISIETINRTRCLFILLMDYSHNIGIIILDASHVLQIYSIFVLKASGLAPDVIADLQERLKYEIITVMSYYLLSSQNVTMPPYLKEWSCTDIAILNVLQIDDSAKINASYCPLKWVKLSLQLPFQRLFSRGNCNRERDIKLEIIILQPS